MAKVQTKNFFRQMRDFCILLENSSLPEDYSSTSVETFYKMVAFVEACPFSQAFVKRFVCQNWRLDTPRLTVLWNNSQGGDKSVDTMRKQVGLTSNYLSCLFGANIYNVFLSDDKDAIENVDSSIDALFTYYVDGEEKFASTMFPEEVCSLASVYCSDTSLEDCKEEIAFLKVMERKNIYNVADSLDNKKLSYLLGVLSQPLFVHKKGIREQVFNPEKLALLKELNCFGEVSLSDVLALSDSSSITETEGGFSMEYISTEKETVPKYQRDYGALDMQTVIDSLEARSVTAGSLEDANIQGLDEFTKKVIINFLGNPNVFSQLRGSDCKEILTRLKASTKSI